jgi:hypothetical protein
MDILLYLAIACFAAACVLMGIYAEKYFARRKRLSPYQYVDAIWYEAWRRPEEIHQEMQDTHNCWISPPELNHALEHLLLEEVIMHRLVSEVTPFGVKPANEFKRTPPDFGAKTEPVIPLLKIHA